MNGRKQHVDFHRKLLLRRRLLVYSNGVEGAAYVPFIGDGDLAVELYTKRLIYGADLDAARVETAGKRLPGSEIRVANCDSWPFPDVSEPFAFADFDAYVNPYLALVAFWSNARKARRMILFGTDGLRQRIKRGRCLKSLPGGGETPATLTEARRAYNFWWTKHVKPFIVAACLPYRIVVSRSYLRKDMLYWGVVLDA